MRATEAFKLKNVAPGTYPVIPDGHGSQYLFGGRYQFQAFGTGTGSVVLQQQAADGSTFESSFTAVTTLPNVQTVDLPPGKYQIVIATFTANYVSLTRVPVSE